MSKIFRNLEIGDSIYVFRMTGSTIPREITKGIIEIINNVGASTNFVGRGVKGGKFNVFVNQEYIDKDEAIHDMTGFLKTRFYVTTDPLKARRKIIDQFDEIWARDMEEKIEIWRSKNLLLEMESNDPENFKCKTLMKRFDLIHQMEKEQEECMKNFGKWFRGLSGFEGWLKKYTKLPKEKINNLIIKLEEDGVKFKIIIYYGENKHMKIITTRKDLEDVFEEG